MDEQNNENEIMEAEGKAPFTPSPKWKRILAWVLAVIITLGVITWLLNMAFPEWIDAVKLWFAGLFS